MGKSVQTAQVGVTRAQMIGPDRPSTFDLDIVISLDAVFGAGEGNLKVLICIKQVLNRGKVRLIGFRVNGINMVLPHINLDTQTPLFSWRTHPEHSESFSG